MIEAARNLFRRRASSSIDMGVGGKKDEIICRRENYGGTLFHPADATFLQLDHDGFNCVKRIMINGEKAQNKDERAFIKDVRASLFHIDANSELPIRLVEHASPVTKFLPGVLSAPILVDWQITERCGMGCPQCYASSVVRGKDVSWSDAELCVSQMREAGVCQVALGGGEPVLHPRLGDLLQLIRDNGMVPNMTTTGIGMTKEQIKSMKRNCGAVAMSLEGAGEKFAIRRKQGFDNFRRVTDLFLENEIPLVMQITVSNGNLEYLDETVAHCLGVTPLYGVVFLAHKPAGRAEVFDHPLSKGDFRNVHETMYRVVRTLQPHTRVGFDCCFTPGMVGLEKELGLSHGTIIEGCSATRSGVGLSPELDVLPCTFLTNKKLGNLKEKSLLKIWNDSYSNAFRLDMEHRSKEDTECRTCSSNSLCMGGCSAWRLVGCVTKEPLQ